jgi:molybdopterin/thiamine biosynthesis adenylyltransferase
VIVRFVRAAYEVLLAQIAKVVGVETHAYLVGLRLLGEVVVLHVVRAGNPVETATMARADYGASAVALKPLLDRGLVLLGEVHEHLGFVGLSRFDEQTLRDLSPDFAGYVAVVITSFPDERSPILRAASMVDGVLTEHEVIISDTEVLLPSRTRTERILQVGLGSLGSPVALQVSKLGVEEILLVDDDLVEARNLPRHILTSRSVGQPKVRAVHGFIRQRTTSRVRSMNLRVQPSTDDKIRELVRGSTIVLNTSGDPRVAFPLSRAAVIEQRLCFHSAVFAKGAGGMVFRQEVGGPCYECLYALTPRPIIEDQTVLDTLQRQYGYTEEELSAHLGLWVDVNLVAALQAKLLAAFLQGASLPNLHVIDTTSLTIKAVTVQRRADCTTCKGAEQ